MCQDVRNVRFMQGRGLMVNDWMQIKPGATIGPEFGIGHFVGNAMDTPVMLLKTCIGNIPVRRNTRSRASSSGRARRTAGRCACRALRAEPRQLHQGITQGLELPGGEVRPRHHGRNWVSDVC